MPNTLNKFHAFNTNLDVGSINKILRAFHLATNTQLGKYLNLGGNRLSNQTLLAPGINIGAGYTRINPAGGSFIRAGNTVSVTLPSAHGYTNGQLVTITSSNIKTASGIKFVRVGNVVTVNLVAHGFNATHTVTISDTSQTSFQEAFKGTFTITKIDNDNFTYQTTGTGALIGTGLATISDSNFQEAFKGTFPITTTGNPNVFTYTTATSGALTGAGVSAIRTTTNINDGYYYYQLLTSSTRPGGAWNVVTNQP
jgi:hypothetical protein